MRGMPTIGFLGTGLMGAPMARNLLSAGFQVSVWNRTAAKAEALVAYGARADTGVVAAVHDADVVITMLDSGPVVSELVFGRGVAEALGRGATLIDMSSIPPDTAREHARRLAAGGVAHLDAPVSGGTKGAAEGTLAIMVGGDAAVVERMRPVFERLGVATHVGPSGAGQIAKLANQIIVAVTIGAVAEALHLAATAGADAAAVREALMGGFADSRILREHGRRMLQGDYVAGGPIRLQLKDLETAMAAAEDSGLRLPLTEVVTALYGRLADAGDADLDHSALLLLLERDNTR